MARKKKITSVFEGISLRYAIDILQGDRSMWSFSSDDLSPCAKQMQYLKSYKNKGFLIKVRDGIEIYTVPFDDKFELKQYLKEI